MTPMTGDSSTEPRVYRGELALADEAALLRREIVVVLGDGECQEGQVWEAAMLAAQCELPNLHAVVDVNRYQEWGWQRRAGNVVPEPVDRLRDKWAAFGWRVLECDGHVHERLEAA